MLTSMHGRHDGQMHSHNLARKHDPLYTLEAYRSTMHVPTLQACLLLYAAWLGIGVTVMGDMEGIDGRLMVDSPGVVLGLSAL